MSGVLFLILRVLLAVSLYIFLGIVLITLWRDLNSRRELLARNSKLPFIGIRVHEDNDTHYYQFQGSTISIGRNPSNDCVLNSEKVSANHARLYYDQKQWWIEDLKSKNGSFVNDEILKNPTVVVNGDELLFGDVRMTIVQ